MKKLSVILLLAALVSCHKEKVGTSQKQLPGTWELRLRFSGWGGSQTYPAGNNNTITFTHTSQYLANGEIAGAGAYEFSTWTNAWGMPGNLLKLNNLQQGNLTYDHQFEVRIYNDTLKLDNNSTIADGPTLFYKKRK